MINGLTAQFSAMQQVQVRQEVDIAVAKKALDNERSKGDMLVQMISDSAIGKSPISAEPHKGTMIDVRG
ncbi:YjfB family protein [Planctomycetota bacterium]|nr:YjfB family protein [Planctomycetota bacterium]